MRKLRMLHKRTVVDVRDTGVPERRKIQETNVGSGSGVKFFVFVLFLCFFFGLRREKDERRKTHIRSLIGLVPINICIIDDN